MESKFLGVIIKLDITLIIGKRFYNVFDVVVLLFVGLLCDRVGFLLYSIVCFLCYVFDIVYRYVYILSILFMYICVFLFFIFY